MIDLNQLNHHMDVAIENYSKIMHSHPYFSKELSLGTFIYDQLPRQNYTLRNWWNCIFTWEHTSFYKQIETLKLKGLL